MFGKLSVMHYKVFIDSDSSRLQKKIRVFRNNPAFIVYNVKTDINYATHERRATILYGKRETENNL